MSTEHRLLSSKLAVLVASCDFALRLVTLRASLIVPFTFRFVLLIISTLYFIIYLLANICFHFFTFFSYAQSFAVFERFCVPTTIRHTRFMLTSLQNCQTIAWKRYHKVECRQFQKKLDAPQKLSSKPITRAVIRLLAMKEQGTLSDEEWDRIQVLETHWNKFKESPADADTCNVAAMLAMSVMGERSMFMAEELRLLVARVRSLDHRDDITSYTYSVFNRSSLTHTH